MKSTASLFFSPTHEIPQFENGAYRVMFTGISNYQRGPFGATLTLEFSVLDRPFIYMTASCFVTENFDIEDDISNEVIYHLIRRKISPNEQIDLNQYIGNTYGATLHGPSTKLKLGSVFPVTNSRLFDLANKAIELEKDGVEVLLAYEKFHQELDQLLTQYK